MVLRIALWGPLLIAALLVGGYIYAHKPFTPDGTELLLVPLSEDDPTLDRVGDLKYLGGLDIPRIHSRTGGLSGLRWDPDGSELFAISDEGRRHWIKPEEADDGVLVGIAGLVSGVLFDSNMKRQDDKEQGDSESVTRSPNGDWLIGFERNHRIWTYSTKLSARAMPTGIDPQSILGSLEDNAGIEALATTPDGAMLICAERPVQGTRANCALDRKGDGKFVPFAAEPPAIVTDRGAVPTDADTLSDGTFLILFRSYSPAEGNTAAIVAYAPDGTRREIATFLPPLTLDNFEGLAVREEEDRTFLYIVSDDNFSGSQRTLLMKFEIVPKA